MEDLDVRLVIRKFLSRWPLFAISTLVALLVAFIYLQSTEKSYLVKASVQLKDQGLSEKGSATEKFINGLELLESNAELEDEIAILSSFSNVRQSIEKIGNYTNVYRCSQFKPAKEFFAKEIYGEDITLAMDTSKPQLIDVPIHILFVDPTTYAVRIEADNGNMYHFSSHKPFGSRKNIEFYEVGKVGQPFESPYISFTLMPVDTTANYWENDYYFINHSLKDIAEYYQWKLKVNPIAEKSNIVTLTLQGAVPEKEIQFLNTLASVYVENDLDKRNKLGLKTINFIDKQLTKVSDTLQQVEGSLESFRAKSKVIDINVSSQMLITLLNDLEEKQIERKAQHEYYEHIANYLEKNSALTDVVAPSAVGINDPTLNSLLEDLTTLNREKVTVTYNSTGDKNPVLRTLDQKIDKTKKALQENIQSLVRKSDISIQDNQRRINEVKQNLSRLPANERNLNGIQRKFDLNDNLYKYLLEKKAEAGIVLASNAPDKGVIDAARQVGNKPVSPNPLFIVLIALMIGLVMPAGFLSVKDYFVKVVENEEQVEKAVSIPIVASINYDNQSKRRGPISHDLYNDSTFQAICHQLKFKNYQVIGVTSMTAAEGKTYCAINLAVSMARNGSKTLLIDTDFYRGGISTKFFLDGDDTLIDAIQREIKVRIHQTPIPNLDIIASGKLNSGVRSKSLVDYLQSVLEDLKTKYDYIILDTSPVGIISDYVLFASYVDHTMIVVRDNFTNADSLNKLNKIIANADLRDKSTIIYNGTKNAKEYYKYYRKVAG